MSNGLVTTLVATVVGVATALVMSRLLGEQPAVVREPIAQGIGFVAAWLCVWPWMWGQSGWATPRRGLVGLAQRAGFAGYVIWIVFGIVMITAVRLYLRTG